MTHLSDDHNLLIRALNDFMKSIGTYMDRFGVEPLEHSIATSEIASFSDLRIIEAAFIQGGLLIESSADHLIAFIKSVSEPVLTLAPWSLVRMVIEGSALSCWFLDPSIGNRDRSGRSLAWRYAGLREQLKIANISKDNETAVKVIHQIDALEARAIQIGFSPVRNKKGKRDGIGQRMPRHTKLVKQTLDMEIEYRLFSAVVHSHAWATTQAGFKKQPSLSGYLLEKRLTLEMVLMLSSFMIRSFTKAIWFKAKLYGWDLPQLEQIFQHVFGQTKIPKSYWH